MGPAVSDLKTHKSGWLGALQSVMLDQFGKAQKRTSSTCVFVSCVSLLLGYTLLAAAEKEPSCTTECTGIVRPA